MDRTYIALNENWKFHYGEEPQAWYKGYDDSAWTSVELPHDWSVHMPFEKTNSSGTGYLSGGIGWYRVRFSLPEAYKGKRVRVVFDGIYKNSRIWCNSYHIGKRPYGYTQISYDITDFVRFGAIDNEITVRVCHTDLADSRWFTGSGIYRKAYLVVEEPIHAVWNGVAFHVSRADEQSTAVHADAELANELDERVIGTLTASLKLCGSEGEPVVFARVPAAMEAHEKKTFYLNGMLAQPKLWSCEKPDLYELCVSFETEEGSAIVLDKERVGIRTFVFDPDYGFFLNGKETKFKGVCVHHDGGCLGAAMYREVWLRRLLKLKEAGCNAIRCSHNPHMPELYDLCDELGLLMMDEAFDEWENPKNKWSTGHNVYPPKHEGYAEDFPEWHERDLKDMVRRDRNHPSIVMWSIGNEIDYPNDPYCHPLFETMTGNNDANKPEKERQYDPDKPNAERLSVIAKELAAIVRTEDTIRPVTLAAAFPELSSHIGFFDALDVVGYNYKEHLYEESHKRFPDKPFLGSENGGGYEQWCAVRDNAYISGQFLWTGIDYLGEAHGWPIHGSAAGLMDLAGFEKPGYYRRKAFWSTVPFICILTRPDDGDEHEWRPWNAHWNYKEGEKVVVRVFTNVEKPENAESVESTENTESAKTVSLSVVGAEGEKVLRGGTYLEKEGCTEWRFSYESGVLKAVCGETECSIRTAGKAAQLSAKVWSTEDTVDRVDQIEKADEAIANGKEEETVQKASVVEVMQIEVSLTDKNGVLAAEDLKITAEVIGGILLGLENGDLADLTPYHESHRKTHNGRLIVYVKPKEGVKVCISCPALAQKVWIG